MGTLVAYLLGVTWVLPGKVLGLKFEGHRAFSVEGRVFVGVGLRLREYDDKCRRAMQDA